jgi:hypothetical protein
VTSPYDQRARHLERMTRREYITRLAFYFSLLLFCTGFWLLVLWAAI